MLRAFSTAATGMSAQQMMVDVIANNLANINTSGFKKSQVDFQDLLYVSMQQAGAEVGSGTLAPGGVEVGSGVRTAATVKVFTQGELQNTGSGLDCAIQGEGFFQVTTPTGDKRYTRDGAFFRSADGTLVTASGYPLSPTITIPADVVDIDIAQDGTVNGTSASGMTTIGQIQLARFANPSGLSNEGGNLLAETPASGAATLGAAGSNGMGSIQSGFLEKSNVQMVTELVNLITAQRAYEINSRAIKAGDDMLQQTNQLVR
jgi:flagellar basal-body rod protein FlgG